MARGIARVLDSACRVSCGARGCAAAVRHGGRTDGQPLRMRLDTPVAGLLGGGPVGMRPCDGNPLQLTGQSTTCGRCRASPSTTCVCAAFVEPRAAPQRRRSSPSPRSRTTRTAVTLTGDCSPCYLSAGQNVDPNWRATRKCGGPGVHRPSSTRYAAGWRTEWLTAQPGAVSYGPAGMARDAPGGSPGHRLLLLALRGTGWFARTVRPAPPSTPQPARRTFRGRGGGTCAVASRGRLQRQRARCRSWAPSGQRSRGRGGAAAPRPASAAQLALAWGLPVWLTVGVLPGRSRPAWHAACRLGAAAGPRNRAVTGV